MRLHTPSSPYRLPISQRQKRRAPPTGQPKYTAARHSAAERARERGEEWQPIKRHQSEAAVEAAAAEDAMSNESSGEGLDDDGGSSGDASDNEED